VKTVQRLFVAGVAVSVAAVLALPVSARAVITPVTTVAGPSSAIVGVGNVAMAGDGSGGVVYEQLSGGTTHVFVAPYRFGAWQPPVEVDAGQPGPASFPQIAAANGGELLVVWVRPYVSMSVGGENPTTFYQLMSSVMAPGSTGFGAPVPVDPHNVGQGSGVSPTLAMAPNGSAYVVYRVVTNALNPDQPQPQGTPLPLRAGDELIDVRVARFNGLTWTSLGTVNAFPGQVTMRPPTPINAPTIAISRKGQAIVVWQEPTIDGVARIWARRLFGATLGNVLEVSPETISKRPVTVDADAPAVSFGLFANAAVAFRLAGGAGSPLAMPTDFVNSLTGSFDVTGGAEFGSAVPMKSAGTIGAPSVAADSGGHFQAAFTAAGQANLVGGIANSVNAPQPVGPSGGEPALATLNPAGGGVIAWPGTDLASRPVVQVRQSFPNGGMQTASLSAAISGPATSLTMGTSGAGDALIAFQQGSGSTTQLAVATVEAPAAPFAPTRPLRWVLPTDADLQWTRAQTTIGGVSYAVVLDGRTVVSGLSSLSYHLPAAALGSGVHHVQIVASDNADEQTFTPVLNLKIDAGPPLVRVRRLGNARVRVKIRDPYSGARAHGTVISFGDGTPPVRNRLRALHQYRRAGAYRMVVRCSSRLGVRAVDHILVRVRRVR
jgi:hypothetical protein